MGIEAEETRLVRADPELVWDLLVHPESWKAWWPACVDARGADGRPLRDGTRLEVVLKPRRLQMSFRPVVDLLTEGKLLSLTHRSAFVHTTFAWYLHEQPDATRVRAEVVFNGVLPFFVTIAQQSSVVGYVLKSNLRGLKAHAERQA